MESESSVKGRESSPGDTWKAPGCRGDGLVGLGHTWKESYLLEPLFCEKQEGRASEQNAGRREGRDGEWGQFAVLQHWERAGWSEGQAWQGSSGAW